MLKIGYLWFVVQVTLTQESSCKVKKKQKKTKKTDSPLVAKSFKDSYMSVNYRY